MVRASGMAFMYGYWCSGGLYGHSIRDEAPYPWCSCEGVWTWHQWPMYSCRRYGHGLQTRQAVVTEYCIASVVQYGVSGTQYHWCSGKGYGYSLSTRGAVERVPAMRSGIVFVYMVQW